MTSYPYKLLRGVSDLEVMAVFLSLTSRLVYAGTIRDRIYEGSW